MQDALRTLKTEGVMDMQILFLSVELEAQLHFTQCIWRVTLFKLVFTFKICLIRPLPLDKYL